MQGKYGEEELGWSSCKVREGHVVGLWKDIIEGLNLFLVVKHSLRCAMGEG